jgi:Fatty acid hydroxylase superfamily
MNRHFYGGCLHQIHHSARRLEIVTSFYKHPVEILVNSILSCLIVYPLFGARVRAAGYYTVLIAVGEFFYHWNIKTPSWIGFIFQRPESHRVHHQFRHHTNNFADIPLWDMLFGTFENPKTFKAHCGYERWRGSIRRHVALPRCSCARRRKACGFAFFADMPRLFKKMGLHRFQTKRCLKRGVDETTRRSLCLKHRPMKHPNDAKISAEDLPSAVLFSFFGAYGM